MSRPGKHPLNQFVYRIKVVIWWAGLMRGAVSIALAYNQVYVVVIWARGININLFNMHACFQFTFSGVTVDPVHAAIITSTIVVVFFTTLVSISPGPAIFEMRYSYE
jgi:hypothetical protein